MEITKRFKALVTGLIVFCLMATNILTAVPVHAAEGSLSLRTTTEKVEQGDTFEVTLGYDGKFVAVEMDVQYDADMLELVASTSGVNGGIYTEPVDLQGVTGQQVVNINGSNINGQTASDGILLKMTFKAKKDVTGTANFALIIKGFYNLDSDYNEVNINYTEENQLKNGIKITAPPTDISELTKKIAEVEAIDSSLYTAASYQSLKAAIAAAKEITTENTKEEVAAQVKALDDAMKQLVKAVDKTELKAVVAEAKTYDESLYTPESYAALSEALDNAQGVLDADLADNAENQKTVADAVQAVKDAIAGLSAKGDQEALAASIQAAEAALARENVTYMDETKANVETALSAAKALVGQENATADEVSTAIKNLNDVVAKLVIAADKDAFNEAVAQVREVFKEEAYTTSSWKAVAEALKNADAMADRLAKGQVPAAEADKVLTDLQNETKGLMAKATKTENLAKAIETAEKLDESHYTADSYAAVKEALATAEKVAGNLNDSTQDQVDTAVANLNTAISKLVTIATDEKTGVTVNGLPAGEKIIVTDKMADKEALASIDEAIKNASEFADAKETKILFLADITPEITENADGSFTVTIPLTDEQLGYDLYYVGHKDDTTGVFTWTAVTPKDNKLTLQVKSFSEFAVVGMVKPEEQTPGTNPSGGSSDNKGDAVNNSAGANASGNNANTGIVQDRNSSAAVAAGFLILAVAGLIAYRKRLNA